MSSFANSNQPPTYQQVLIASQDRLDKHHAPYNPPIPTASVIQITTMEFGNQPVTMSCPYCGQLITTVIEEENGAIVFLICSLLAIFGFVFGCCLIPFCISELKNKIHICPRCQKPVGKKILL